MLSRFLTLARTVVAGSAALYVRASVTALAVTAAYFGLCYAATFIDHQFIASKLERANTDGEFRRNFTAPFGRIFPRYTGNDCLVLAMLLQRYPTRLAEAISVRIPPADTQPPAIEGDPTIPACLQLIAALDRPDHDDAGAIYYHRYLHGQRLYATVALSLFPPQALGWVTLGLNIVVLLCVLLPAVWRGRTTHASREWAYAAVAAAVLLFDGLWVYGLYFSFGISDLVLSGFLAYAYYARVARMPEPKFAVAVAFFSSATAIFEFLTGGIPFGLSVLLGIIAIDGPGNGTALLRRALHGVAIFTLSVFFAFALKIIVVTLLVDPSAGSDFVGGLSNRVGSTFVASLPPQEIAWLAAHGIDASTLERWPLSVLYMLARLAYASFVLGYGSVALGVAMLGAGVIGTAALMVRRWRERTDDVSRMRLIILLGSVLVMPVWSLLFLNHTLLHAIWMVRPFSWFIATAAILMVGGVTAGSREFSR